MEAQHTVRPELRCALPSMEAQHTVRPEHKSPFYF